MGRIYTVTTLSDIEDTKLGIVNVKDTRCVGWFETLADAEAAVLCNNADINENGAYRYAIIETVEEGFYPSGKPRWLYRYDRSKGRYTQMTEPETLGRLCSFGIG